MHGETATLNLGAVEAIGGKLVNLCSEIDGLGKKRDSKKKSRSHFSCFPDSLWQPLTVSYVSDVMCPAHGPIPDLLHETTRSGIIKDNFHYHLHSRI